MNSIVRRNSCMGLGLVNRSIRDTNYDLVYMFYLVSKVNFYGGYSHCFIWKNEYKALFNWDGLLWFMNACVFLA